MSIRNKLAIALVAFLAPFVFASTATAQAGAACSGTSCGLGGQIRGQIGDGLPLPISIAPAQGGSGSAAVSGPFTGITIQSAPATPSGLPLVGKGLGQPGQIKPTTMATIMQTAGPGPRKLTLAPGIFFYGGQPRGSIGVVNFNSAVFAVQTQLTYDAPHPGSTVTVMGADGGAASTQSGAAIPTAAANVFSAGGRVGATIVSYYADATLQPVGGSPTNNFGNVITQTAMAGAGAAVPVNGIARFTKTGNQFGGQSIGRANGTAKVFFNGVALNPAIDLPCKVTATAGQGTNAQGAFVPYVTGPNCQFLLQTVDLVASDATVGVAGGKFNGHATAVDVLFSNAVHTATMGFNGTIIGSGANVTAAGAGIPFTGQGNQGVGMPYTTGRLSVTVTLVQGPTSEMFIRTGTDARDAAGNGVVALVTGSLTARDISGGNANRTWITLEIPEPSAIFAASAGLFALFGMHRLARRRS